MIPAKPNMGYVTRNNDKAIIAALQKQVAQLKRKVVIWNDVEKGMPEFNKGVLVFIPEEDNHITSGMWDISENWVLLDEYRTPESEVTHWAYLPEPPKIKDI